LKIRRYFITTPVHPSVKYHPGTIFIFISWISIRHAPWLTYHNARLSLYWVILELSF
jgi:hypothetical protein